MLCLVDDAHWLDGASADALTFAARRLDAEGVSCCSPPATGVRRPRPDRAAPRRPRPGRGRGAARRTVRRGARRRGARQSRGQHRRQPVGAARAARRRCRRTARRPEALPERLPVSADVEQVFLDRVRRRAPQTQTLLLVAAAEDTGELRVVLRAAADARVSGRRPGRGRDAPAWCGWTADAGVLPSAGPHGGLPGGDVPAAARGASRRWPRRSTATTTPTGGPGTWPPRRSGRTTRSPHELHRSADRARAAGRARRRGRPPTNARPR